MILEGRSWDCVDWESVKRSALEGAVMGAIGGAVGGVLHKAVQAGKIAKRTAWMIGAAYDVGVGAGWDIAVYGRTPSESFARNLVSFAMGEAVGAGVSRLASRVFRHGANTGIDTAARQVDSVAEAAARQADNAAARIRTARRPGAEAGVSLAQRRTWFADETEKFYRAMSENEYSRVIESGGLGKRSRGGSQLFVTTDLEYVASLFGRDSRRFDVKYPIVTEFEVQNGTEKRLTELGIAAIHDPKLSSRYPDLPRFASGMDAVQIKYEWGGVISFGLGSSKLGLELFNSAIITIRRLR